MHRRGRDRFQLFLLMVVLSSGLSMARGFAEALSDAEVRERIREQLALRHPSDTAEFWRGLGPAAPRVIQEMLSQSKSVYERIRLYEGLGWFDAPDAKAAIRRAAEGESNHSILRAELRSLLRNTGESPSDEVEFVAKFMDREGDPTLRAQVGQILAENGSPEALQALERRLGREKTPWVADRLRRSRDESIRLAERERTREGEGTVAGRTGVPVRPEPVTRSLDPAFAGRWEGRWIGVPSKVGSEGVLSRTLSLEATLEADASAGTPRTRIRLVSPGLTPYAAAEGAKPFLPIVLSGSGEEARGAVEPAQWKGLTAGLSQDSGSDRKLTLIVRLIRGEGPSGSALVLESEDGRQHWVFVHR